MKITIEIPIIETETLRLRAPLPSDFPSYRAFRMDPVRTEYLGGPDTAASAFEKLSEIVGHWHLRGFGRFMVADKATDEPLGVVGPYFPQDWPEPEIAWSVFADAEGKGIAYAAALESLRFAYSRLGWKTAISVIHGDNMRSAALAQRLGCVREDDFQHPLFGPLQTWRHPGPEALQ